MICATNAHRCVAEKPRGKLLRDEFRDKLFWPTRVALSSISLIQNLGQDTR